MSELFVKDRILSDYIIDDLKFDAKHLPSYEAGLEGAGIDKSKRSAFIKRLDPNEYPELCRSLEGFTYQFNSKHDPDKLILKELDYLRYGISDHHKFHEDAIPNPNPKEVRRFTTVTLLDKSDDLEGGDLLLLDRDENQISTNLQVGETVIFYSTTYHGVTPITKGQRRSLIGWIYDR